MSSKPSILLVHGAFEDASVWASVLTALRENGFQASAIDLPGRAGDTTPKAEITLETYRDAILGRIAAETNPVVLVGHSFGGIAISTVAEAAPERIQALVYVAAFLPKDGDSQQTLAMNDHDSKLGAALRIDVARMVASVDPAQSADIFINDGTPDQRASFAAKLVGEPLQPPGTPARLSAERFGKVHKTYVFTLRDQAVSHDFQRKMVADSGLADLHEIDSGHTPFLMRPRELAKIIAAASMPGKA